VADDGFSSILGACDKLLGSSIEEKWKGLTSGERTAWGLIFGASALGVIGSSLLSVLGDAGKVPTAESFVAAFWLLAITLPVAIVAAVVAGVLTAGKPVMSGPVALMVLGLLCLGGVVAMNWIIEAAGGSLGNFYCYNDGRILESACRTFDEQGLLSSSGTGPTGAARFMTNVAVLTVDARGWLMVVCGVVAGGAAGYLVGVKFKDA
jgi:hypothetical protein